MEMNPQTNWAGFINESSNRPDCSAVAGLVVRQLDTLQYPRIAQIVETLAREHFLEKGKMPIFGAR